MIRYFSIQNAIGAFWENIKLYWFCLLLLDWYQFFTRCIDFWPLNKILWVFSYQCSQDLEMWLFPFIYYQFWTIEKRDYECWIGTKLILRMFNWYKTDITNVKSVQNWYYECWIALKFCMKRLQNEISQMYRSISYWFFHLKPSLNLTISLVFLIF